MIAQRQKGNTGENLLILMERRLDNVVLSLGLAFSRFDIGGLREDLEKERQHAELRAARRRAAEAPGVTIEIGRGKRPGKG